jgi:hypothetical protein
MAPTPPRADLYDNAASRIRYEAFARLQSTACAFGESLAIPEIVAIGGQSDGKSSLLEALLGVSSDSLPNPHVLAARCPPQHAHAPRPPLPPARSSAST